VLVICEGATEPLDLPKGWYLQILSEFKVARHRELVGAGHLMRCNVVRIQGCANRLLA